MNVIRILIALLVMLVLVGGSNFYLATRVHQFISHLFPNTPGYVRIVLFVLFVLVLMLGFFRSMLPFPTAVKQVLGVINAGWMGVFVYLLVFCLLTDGVALIVQRFCPVNRFYFLSAAMILTCLVCIYGFIHGSRVRQKEYDVTLSGAEDMTVVFISDVHLGAVGSEGRLPEIVDAINAMEPDIVCITGDFFDSDYAAIQDPQAAEATLKRLQATYGVWACLGNHDAGATAADMQAFLARSNVNLLNDECAVIDNKLVLVGRVDGSPIGGYGDLTRQAVELERGDLPVIVMDHNPANIEEYGAEYDLILCGHTHRGQIFPGNLITNAMYMVDYGYYRADENSPQVIVSSGAGTWGMPMRVGTDNEIVKINLHS